jgi:hypothetical protein
VSRLSHRHPHGCHWLVGRTNGLGVCPSSANPTYALIFAAREKIERTHEAGLGDGIGRDVTGRWAECGLWVHFDDVRRLGLFREGLGEWLRYGVDTDDELRSANWTTEILWDSTVIQGG